MNSRKKKLKESSLPINPVLLLMNWPYNCHRSTISHQLKLHDIEVKIEKIDINEAIVLYESGWTTKQIAEKYHMSDNAVSRRLKKAGVKMRTRWDY